VPSEPEVENQLYSIGWNVNVLTGNNVTASFYSVLWALNVMWVFFYSYQNLPMSTTLRDCFG
jgi:hypothetical protein